MVRIARGRSRVECSACAGLRFCGVQLRREEAARTDARDVRRLVHRGPTTPGILSPPRWHWACGGSQSSMSPRPATDCNEDGSIQVVFNGEIYNHHELRRDLIASGHRFRTRGDTETTSTCTRSGVRTSWCGCAGCRHCLVDARARRLVLARDRVGIKPLSLLGHPGRDRVLLGVALAPALVALSAPVDESGPRGVPLLGIRPRPAVRVRRGREVVPRTHPGLVRGTGASVRRY